MNSPASCLSWLITRLTEIETRGPFDLTINAGDLVFGGPRPREAMDLLMQRAYPTIMGNTDEWIAGIEQSRSHVVAWARGRLESRHEQFLRRLLPSYRIEPPGGPPLVAVHATPTSVSDVLDPEAPPNVVARMTLVVEDGVVDVAQRPRPELERRRSPSRREQPAVQPLSVG